MKIAVITGGTDGIGKAMVTDLLKDEYQVFTIGRNVAKLKDISDHNLISFQGDLTDKKSLEEFCAFVNSKSEKIDLLINNAGIQIGNNPLLNFSENDLLTMIQVHVVAPLKLLQAFHPRLKLSDNPIIINIVSNVVTNYLKETYGLYTISKFAEYGLGQMMQKELTKDNFKITNVILGGVETNIRNSLRPEYLKPLEVALAINYLIKSLTKVYIPEICIFPKINVA
ncbi:MAG: SDR family oxidoreductase [bacterium]